MIDLSGMTDVTALPVTSIGDDAGVGLPTGLTLPELELSRGRRNHLVWRSTYGRGDWDTPSPLLDFVELTSQFQMRFSWRRARHSVTEGGLMPLWSLKGLLGQVRITASAT